jgi:transposase
MNISAEQIETKNFGHLGLVAATINKLGIIEKIDEKLPVSKAHGAIVTMGRRVAAMILNGLGFYNDRLYMHSLFFQDKPISLLLGDDINSENLNDDALGRCLDEIYRYGSTKLLSEIAMEIGTKENLLGKSAHLDTSSFTVYGDYSDNDLLEEINLGKTEVELTPFEEIKSPPVLTYGHAKNKRSDLKQVIISLTTSGPAGLPIWMEALDGNKSDKKSFQETLRKMRLFQQQLADAPTFLYVADAELYVKDKLLKNTNLRWLTRVPERIKEAKSLCEMSEETFCWECIGNGYQAVNLGSNYGGLNQRWQLIYSEQAYAKEIKTFKKRVKKEEEATEKKLQKISAKLFSNQDEAKNELALLTRKFKYHLIEEKIIEIKMTKKFRGGNRTH